MFRNLLGHIEWFERKGRLALLADLQYVGLGYLKNYGAALKYACLT